MSVQSRLRNASILPAVPMIRYGAAVVGGRLNDAVNMLTAIRDYWNETGAAYAVEEHQRLLQPIQL